MTERIEYHPGDVIGGRNIDHHYLAEEADLQALEGMEITTEGLLEDGFTHANWYVFTDVEPDLSDVVRLGVSAEVRLDNPYGADLRLQITRASGVPDEVRLVDAATDNTTIGFDRATVTPNQILAVREFYARAVRAAQERFPDHPIVPAVDEIEYVT